MYRKENLNEYVTYQSNEMEFLDVSTNEISGMSFEIRTHTGKPFEFDQDSDVFIDLIFKNFEKAA